MTEQCFDFGLPAPLFFFKSSGFWVEFRKDIFNQNELKSLGLSDRQIKAVLFTKDNGKINNSDYQTLNGVSKATATRDLIEKLKNSKCLTEVEIWSRNNLCFDWLIIGSIGS